ncbi:MAG: hypothetical protein IIZ07_02890 [Ruminococcus sp.]|nr:hypothetical protein [Ruminococcus sp.]
MMTPKDRYYRFKREHRCTACGRTDARTLVGKTKCERCAQSFKEYRERNRERLRESQRESMSKIRARRLALHQCSRCGKPKPEGYFYTECVDCREYTKELKKKKTAKRGNA